MENDERARKMDEETFLASALAKETGITLDEARSLIEMIGTDRNSLLREARILKKRQDDLAADGASIPPAWHFAYGYRWRRHCRQAVHPDLPAMG